MIRYAFAIPILDLSSLDYEQSWFINKVVLAVHDGCVGKYHAIMFRHAVCVMFMPEQVVARTNHVYRLH